MLIKNGIVSLSNINIIQKLIPESHTYSRPQYLMIPEYITIHNTGDDGASALAISNYVTTQTGYKSWHFTVGNGVVYQHLPITESGWHAGDGINGTGNRKSIGIEICEVDGAEETAIKFIAELLQATNLNRDKVVPHKYWSGKICPRLILPHWDVFIVNIKKEMMGLTLDEARKIIQDKAELDNNSMQYLEFYKYGEDLIKKLAVPMVNKVVIPEPVIETPIVDNSIKFTSTINGTFQLSGRPQDLKLKVVNKSNTKIIEDNCVNSTFFWQNPDGTKYSTSILYANDTVYQNNANHLPSPQSVFIIYKDGKVELKRLFNLNGIDLSKIHLAIGGVGLLSDDANFSYNPSLDGFSGAYSDVLRKTNKTVIGYNKSEDRIYLMCRKDIIHQSALSYDLLTLVKDCGYSIALSLDGGGSTFMRADGKTQLAGDGRVIHSLLQF